MVEAGTGSVAEEVEFSLWFSWCRAVSGVALLLVVGVGGERRESGSGRGWSATFDS